VTRRDSFDANASHFTQEENLVVSVSRRTAYTLESPSSLELIDDPASIGEKELGHLLSIPARGLYDLDPVAPNTHAESARRIRLHESISDRPPVEPNLVLRRVSHHFTPHRQISPTRRWLA
jgi:hypothetical protein